MLIGSPGIKHPLRPELSASITNPFKEPRGKRPDRAPVSALAQFVHNNNKLTQREVKWMRGYLAPGTKETIQNSQLLYTSLEHIHYRVTVA